MTAAINSTGAGKRGYPTKSSVPYTQASTQRRARERSVAIQTLLLVRKSKSSSFYFQAEDGIRDLTVTGVQTCALPIFTTHAQWVGEMEKLLDRGRARAAFVPGHTSFEV